MKIFDCITYYDEDLLLDLRINILNDYVDEFIIVESKEDHQGKIKDLNFDIKKFKKFEKKINYIVQEKIDIDKNLKLPKNWSKAHLKDQAQRNFISTGFNKIKENDLIIISDLDEIPNPKQIYKFNPKNKFAIFKQKLFYYKFNLLSISEPDWYGSRICVKKHLISPQWMRNKKIKRSFLKKFFGINKIQIIENGGWHFSYVKEPVDIVKKIESFAHTEFNKQEFKNLSEIKEKIEKGKDLFNRNLKYEKVELDDSFPEYLLNNKSKFINWIA